MSASKLTRSDYAPAAQKAAAVIRRKQKKEVKLTPRIRAAIDLMVFDGMTRPEAAQAIDISDSAMRMALTRPNCLKYMNEQIEVLRTGARPQAVNQVVKLMTKAVSERVQLDAAKYIDGMDRGAHQIGATMVNVQVNNSTHLELPGYVIDLRETQSESVQQIDHLPHDEDNDIVTLDDVPDDE